MTTTDTTKRMALTVTNIKNVLAELPRDKHNPTIQRPGQESRACVYTNPDDPNDHCIAGEVLVRMGYADLLPPIEADVKTGFSVSSLLKGSGQPVGYSAINLLRDLQTEADGRVLACVRHTRPWGTAIDGVLRRRGVMGTL